MVAFGPATAGEIPAAEILTGLAMALYLVPGMLPGKRPKFVWKLRAWVLAVFLPAAVVCLGYAVAQ